MWDEASRLCGTQQKNKTADPVRHPSFFRVYILAALACKNT